MAKVKEDTPLLKQYFSIKAQHPEAILLYRVGDFYETYSDDALEASKILGIVLTRRSNGDKGEMPMAGFPYHAMDIYLPKLIRAGKKVAVCDQLEDPKLAATKLVKRGITEILTPGIAFGETMLSQKENNFMAGLCFDSNLCGAAFLDVSTGTFQVAQGSIEYIGTLLDSFSCKEVIVQRELLNSARERFPDFYFSALDEWAFVQDAAQEKLCRQLGVDSLKGFAIDIFPLAICAAGALIYYLEQSQHIGLKNICSISRIDEGKFVWMDKFTFRNLEIFSPASGDDGVCLLNVLDNCSSPMGSRLLRHYLALPSMDLRELENRYDIVEHFTSNEDALDRIRTLINNVGDLERSISRAATGKILPREVMTMKRSLSQMQPIKELCGDCGNSALESLVKGMRRCDKLVELISRTLGDDPASAIGKGDVIAEGVDSQLDELRSISRGGKDFLLQIQQREIERTGITSLKISYNNVFGYYIEVRNTFKDKVPPEWIRKQTLVNAERFITEELKEYEEKILGAESAIYEIESRIFSNLISEIQKCIRDIQENCQIVSKLDVLSNFAFLALERNYCRPEMNKGNVLDIKDGRHPVIETLMNAGEEYVANDVHLDSSKDQIIIVTGPNMSGKSAILRQTALIVLMAQIGSFVPASAASIGYFDKIFTRVGATDNISRGESTFMVEMLETSMIMHNLSSRSLVLLDEIGRGTSTYDGMSIARALVEYVHEYGKGAKTLFATHYHELNDMEEIFPRVKNFHITVKESGTQVIFLRKFVPGGVDQSFGIHVARMAGMPREVIDSAERTLRILESKSKKGICENNDAVQLSFFQMDDPTLSSLRDSLAGADLNNMTPMQAFDLLRRMKQELGL